MKSKKCKPLTQKAVSVAVNGANSQQLPAQPNNDVKLLTPLSRHEMRRLERHKRPKAFTPKLWEEFCERLEQGEYPIEIIDRSPGMPSHKTLRQHIAANAEAMAQYEAATSALADLVLQDAAQFLRDSASTGDVDNIRIADYYAKGAAGTLAKLSPKTHGELIKLAGADGGSLSVAVINYAEQKRDA